METHEAQKTRMQEDHENEKYQMQSQFESQRGALIQEYELNIKEQSVNVSDLLTYMQARNSKLTGRPKESPCKDMSKDDASFDNVSPEPSYEAPNSFLAEYKRYLISK